MRALCLVEKAPLMREIEKAYRNMSFPDKVDFMAFRGHILRQKSPDEYSAEWGQPWRMEALPMIPTTFEYKVIKEKGEGGRVNDCTQMYEQIKEALLKGGYDYVINACDAGREGELIFYEVYDNVKCKLPVKRFWCSSTTESAFQNALRSLIDGKTASLVALRASSYKRAQFDWLVGMNFTRALSICVSSVSNVGRVMTPVLAMVVDRELEIRNFISKDYWEIEADFGKYKGTWFDPETNETKIFEKAKAENLVGSMSKIGIVDEVKKEKETNYAPTLHSLTELQKEASNAFGYSADVTLAIAQVLYEEKKLITYPRTESRYLPTDMVKEIPKHLNALTGLPEIGPIVKGILANPQNINSVLSTKKYVDDKKLTDHHAVLPTDVVPDLSTLTEQQRNIYMLVAKRLTALFLGPYIVDKTTIVTKVDNESFKTTGRVVVEKGYMALYKEDKKDVTLPAVNKGENYTVVEFKTTAKKTTPPNRYDAASLLTAMLNAGKFIDDEQLKSVLKETAGLGTTATRAAIIKKLVDITFLELKGKYYYATDRGIQIITALKGKDIISPELTAKWEMKLRDIEDLKYNIDDFEKEMFDYIKKQTEEFLKIVSTKIQMNTSTAEKVGKCPVCGLDVVEGKNFYRCINYKGAQNPCDFVFGKVIGGVKLKKTDVKKILSGGETSEYEFTSKTGSKYKDALKVIDGKVAPVRIVTGVGRTTSSVGPTNNGAPEKAGSAEPRPPRELKEIGKCPVCGDNVVCDINSYHCSKKECNFSLAKTIKDGIITVDDAKAIISGKETDWIDFLFRNGKRGLAKLYWNSETGIPGWIFPK